MHSAPNAHPHSRLARAALWSMAVLCLAVVAAGGRATSASRLLRLGHSLDTSHPVHLGLERFAAEVAERTKGRIEVRIHPNSQLGSEREMIELVQLGALDLVKTSTSPLEGFVPVMGLFSIPYVFRDDAHYWAVLDGPIGQRLLKASEGQRLRGLCFYDAGSRSFYTRNRLIRTPADLRGLKIRVQNSRTSMRMVQAMGGAPTPLSFAELYSALQQGVVDGAENNPPSVLSARHHEVCKHYTLDEHTRVPDIVLMNARTWNRLSREDQTLLKEAAEASAIYQRRLWSEKTEEALVTLREEGVEILRPDPALFAAAVRGIQADYDGTPVGDLLEEIRRHGPDARQDAEAPEPPNPPGP